MTGAEPPRPQPRASQLLRVPAVWAAPALVGTVLVLLITVFYVGSVINPLGHLHGLPVSLVDEDRGVTIGHHRVDVGQQVVSGLEGSRVLSTLLSLKQSTLADAEARMNRDGAYATIVIPPEFTASLLTTAGLIPAAAVAPEKPPVELLTNQRAGSEGAALASDILQPAFQQLSQRIGRQLAATAASRGIKRSAAAGVVLADPVALATVPYRPLPDHSALGLSAFYIALLTMMCGFLGAIIVNTTVDSALGYAATEVGPRWRQREPLAISR